MAVVELGWTPDRFWHSAWHEFHGAIEYLTEKRLKEAEAVRDAGRGMRVERDVVQVKVKGQAMRTLGAAPAPTFEHYPGDWQPAAGPAAFAAFRDSIVERFGKVLT